LKNQINKMLIPNHKHFTIKIWFNLFMDHERYTLISNRIAVNTDLAININSRINMEIWVHRIRTNTDNIRLKELGFKE
jgi:hypothetical protein